MPCRMKPPSRSSSVLPLSRWSASSTCSCRAPAAVLDPPLAQPHQHLAALDEAADDQRLQAGEVGEAVGVGRGGELDQSRSACVASSGVAARAAAEAGADHVADQRPALAA